FFAMPAVLAPTAEVTANYSWFTGREVVPEWMRNSRSPLNQFTPRTDPIWGHAVAQALTATIGWAFDDREFSPMMTEHWIRQMTGGGSHTISGILTSIYDGVTGDPWKALMENPLNPIAAVSGQREFGQAFSTDRLYALNSRLTRYKDSLSPEESALRPIISAARDQIGVLNDLRRRGILERTEADRRAAEIARRALKTYEENVR
ncbi:MAG TPA: LPD38 domain-containing protein, partial [Thermoleophilia bacterium]|nr:LPD38 domain-containing protein [Thermoleophilia bacterium]